MRLYKFIRVTYSQPLYVEIAKIAATWKLATLAKTNNCIQVLGIWQGCQYCARNCRSDPCHWTEAEPSHVISFHLRNNVAWTPFMGKGHMLFHHCLVSYFLSLATVPHNWDMSMFCGHRESQTFPQLPSIPDQLGYVHGGVGLEMGVRCTICITRCPDH